MKIAFKTDYHVKTIEQVYGIKKEYEMCYLLSPSAIQKHKDKGHNFLHIGLVQVGVKPLTKRGYIYIYIYHKGGSDTVLEAEAQLYSDNNIT